MILFLAFASLSLSLIFWSWKFNAVSLVIFILLCFYAFFRCRKNLLIALGFFCLGTLEYFIVPKSLKGTFDATGFVTKSGANYFLIATLKGVIYIPSKNCPYEVGDFLKIQGTFSELAFTHYQESFDFAEYLNSLGCFVQGNTKAVAFILKTPFRMRSLSSFFLKGYSEEAQALIGCLVFGTSAADLKSYFSLQSLGVIHLLSSSGIHLGLLNELSEKALEGRTKRKNLSFVLLLNALLMFFLSSFSLGMFRILVMNFLVFLKGREKIGGVSYPEKLSLAGLVTLIFNPFYVLNIGFFYTYPVLMLFGFRRALFDKRTKFVKIRIGLAFGIISYPLTLFSAYGFSPFSFIFQILLAPFFGFLFVIDLLVFGSIFTRPFLEAVNSWCGNFLFASRFFDSVILSGRVSWYFIIFYFLVYCSILYFKELRLKKVFLSLSVLLSFSCVLLLAPDLSQYYEVRFIDVGQGDSTLVRCGKYNVLIDTGGNTSVDLAKSCLIPYFRSLKIYYLDAVLTTHDDYDHIGALDSLKENFTVKEIIKGGSKQKIDIGCLSFTDLNNYRSSAGDSNFNSAVYSFKIRSLSFLVMGDAPQAIEKDIIADKINAPCDVLKVGHHGSDTSSSAEWLKYTSPSLAVISCGYHNKYGHPSASTIAALESLSISYVRTDKVGTYVCQC